ncbi:hypothetical protein [Aliivibrio fischeri]|uniref:hypothetical protein n=1 Tax=Aliivibrio fischeri TaxID=668 RepID=UPI0007C46D12|nr:hypothetical protein [Aliivibrio fischeri]
MNNTNQLDHVIEKLPYGMFNHIDAYNSLDEMLVSLNEKFSFQFNKKETTQIISHFWNSLHQLVPTKIANQIPKTTFEEDIPCESLQDLLEFFTQKHSAGVLIIELLLITAKTLQQVVNTISKELTNT